MQTYGGSGRSSRWYGDELAVLAGRLCSEFEVLPDHEPAPRKEATEPPPKKRRVRTRRRLNSRRVERQREREWTIANGIWTDE